MIKLEKLTPRVYYDQSRDFQFIGRLYDLVLNSVKSNTDLIYGLPLSEDSDTAFLELLSLTLGFKSLHDYNILQLKSLCAAFAEVIRNKGNALSIEKACNALLGAEGVTDKVRVVVEGFELIIFIPKTISDINLLRDLMNYILPAGMSYNIIKVLELEVDASTTITNYKDKVLFTTEHEGTVSRIVNRYNVKDGHEKRIWNKAGVIMNTTIVDKTPKPTNSEGDSN